MSRATQRERRRQSRASVQVHATSRSGTASGRVEVKQEVTARSVRDRRRWSRHSFGTLNPVTSGRMASSLARTHQTRGCCRDRNGHEFLDLNGERTRVCRCPRQAGECHALMRHDHERRLSRSPLCLWPQGCSNDRCQHADSSRSHGCCRPGGGARRQPLRPPRYRAIASHSCVDTHRRRSQGRTRCGLVGRERRWGTDVVRRTRPGA